MSVKSISTSCKVNTSAKEVWNKWTTAKGLRSFFGKENNIDLRIGGPYEIYYLMNNEEGYRGSEGCKILSFLPQKMISFTWTAPPQFKSVRNEKNQTWVVLFIDEIEPQKTKITIHHLGWPSNNKWDKVYKFYQHAWGFILNGLIKSIH